MPSTMGPGPDVFPALSQCHCYLSL